MLLVAIGVRAGHPAATPATRQPHVLQRHIYGWAKSFVNCLTWATPKATSIQVQRGSRTWNKFAPGEASKQSPSRKQLQPTLWEWNCMIACTHHAAFDVWTLGLAKAFAALHLRMITFFKLQGSFLLTESHVLSLGLKCTDRSRWSLEAVTSGHSRASIFGTTALIVEHQP